MLNGYLSIVFVTFTTTKIVTLQLIYKDKNRMYEK